MLWDESSTHEEYPLGAARGCLYGSIFGAALWALLFCLGYALAAVRYP